MPGPVSSVTFDITSPSGTSFTDTTACSPGLKALCPYQLSSCINISPRGIIMKSIGLAACFIYFIFSRSMFLCAESTMPISSLKRLSSYMYALIFLFASPIAAWFDVYLNMTSIRAPMISERNASDQSGSIVLNG